MSPRRIQRKRTKGWRMPEGTVYVGRPTRYGNPYARGNPEENVANYRIWLGNLVGRNKKMRDEAMPFLRGRDLACWCPLDQPCHADVLLEWANQ